MSLSIGAATRTSLQSVARARSSAAERVGNTTGSAAGAGPATVAAVAPVGAPSPRPWLAPRDTLADVPPSREGSAGAGSEPASGAASAAGGSGAAADDPALAAVTRQYESRLTDLATDPEAFHETLATAFGGGYDRAEAEGIRRQVLAGDFSWMPEVHVVDGATLRDTSGIQGPGAQGLGAYDAAGDTIYLSRELLEGDPAKAVEILTEEVGHGLDARLNTSDAAGDEGDIFSRLVGGETISADELTALRAENDGGTIVVDGREVRVEYGLFGGIGKIFKGVGKAIGGAFKGIGNAIKGAFKWVMESQLFGMILMVAQFIPIPVVALAARIAIAARSAYMAAKGIQHGSMAMVLGGVAGVAGGVAQIGGALGASASFVDGAAKVARYAGMASKGYAAIARGDFSSALSLASSAFGSDPNVGGYVRTAENVLQVKRAVDRGDVLGAAGLGVNAMSSIPGMENNRDLAKAGEHLATIGAVRGALGRGDYAAAASLLTGGYGDALGLGGRARRTVEDVASVLGTLQTATGMLDERDYGGAAGALLGQAAKAAPAGSALRDNLVGLGRTFERIDGAAADIGRGNLNRASETVLSLLGEPLDEATKGHLLGLLERIESLGGPARGADAGTPAPI